MSDALRTAIEEAILMLGTSPDHPAALMHRTHDAAYRIVLHRDTPAAPDEPDRVRTAAAFAITAILAGATTASHRDGPYKVRIARNPTGTTP